MASFLEQLGNIGQSMTNVGNTVQGINKPAPNMGNYDQFVNYFNSLTAAEQQKILAQLQMKR